MFWKTTEKKWNILWIGTDKGNLVRCVDRMRRLSFQRIPDFANFPMQIITQFHLILIDTKAVSGDFPVAISKIRKIHNIPILALGSLDCDSADISVPYSLSVQQIGAYITALIYLYDGAGEWWESDGKFPIVQGDFFLDQWNRWADVCGKTVLLSEELCRLLAFFLRNTSRLISYQELARTVWFVTGAYGRDEQSMVAELSAKIEIDPQCPQYICEIPGAGYRFRSIGELREIQQQISE